MKKNQYLQQQKRISFLSIFVLCNMLCFGQGFESILTSEDTTFSQVYERVTNAYKENQNDPTIDYDQFFKWANYWRPRLTENGIKNGMNGANAAITDFIINLEVCADDGGKVWEELGPFNSDGMNPSMNYSCNGNVDYQNVGRIDAISVDPENPDWMVAGGANGGIWLTQNGGQNWTNRTDESGYSLIGISEFVRHPDDHHYIFASTSTFLGPYNFHKSHSYGIGIIFSRDNGLTWEPSGYNFGYRDYGLVNCMAIDPQSTMEVTKLYLGANNRFRKYEVDLTEINPDGQTTNIEYGFGDYYIPEPYYVHGNPIVNDVCIDIQGNVWFANNLGLFKYYPDTGVVENTRDQNSIPAAITNVHDCDYDPFGNEFLIQEIEVETNEQGHIVALIRYVPADVNCEKLPIANDYYYVHKTTNFGEDWETPFISGGNFLFLKFKLSTHNSEVIYAESINRCLVKSTDGGSTFNAMNTQVNHADIRYMEIYSGIPNDPNGNNDILYVGTDGGVSMTSNGNDFVDITGEGMACTNFLGVAITEQDENYIVAGAQDGNINFYNNGEWFETRPGGDNGPCIIDPLDMNLVYQTDQGRIWRTVQNASNTDFTTTPLSQVPQHKWFHPMILNPMDRTELFTGTRSLYRLQNANTETSGWEQIYDATLHSNKLISSVAMSENNKDIVYYSLYHQYTNGGAFESQNDSGIYKAERPTTPNGVWQISDISSNLKTLFDGSPSGSTANPIMDIAVDPDDENNIWIVMGRFNGKDNSTPPIDYPRAKVFYTKNGGDTWLNDSSCLPDIPMTKIVYQRGSNDGIYVGSDYGVFYKNADMDDWVHYGTGGPKALIADMAINNSAGKLVVATQGRGMWKVPLADNDDVMTSTEQEGKLNDSENQVVNAFPNPAKNLVNFQFQLPKSIESGQLKVYDNTNNLIKEISLTENSGIKVWNTTNLPQGLYFYQVQHEASKSTAKKLVISR